MLQKFEDIFKETFVQETIWKKLLANWKKTWILTHFKWFGPLSGGEPTNYSIMEELIDLLFIYLLENSGEWD